MLLPRYVYSAIQNGYEITYLAAPFYFARPTNSALVGIAQSLVLIVEHALTFGLWTMVGKWTPCKRLALWDVSSLEYEGLNSHSPMWESRDMEEINPDEIELILEQRRQRDNDVCERILQEEQPYDSETPTRTSSGEL